MSMRNVVVGFCAFLLPLAAPTPFQRRGNLLAPYSNLTSSIVPVLVTAPWPSHAEISVATSTTPVSGTAHPSLLGESTYSITGTGPHLPIKTGLSNNHTGPLNNYTGPPCTVNVPQASVDWWYAATYVWEVGNLLTVEGDNFTEVHFTNMPNTATFDVQSAMNEPAYTMSEVYDPDWDMTFTMMAEYTVTPSATITSIVSRTAYSPIPSGKIILEHELPSYQLDIGTLGPATMAIAGPNRTAFVATSATPVAYFSAYEVETAIPVTAEDGQVASTTITQTFNLPEPYAYPYHMKGIEDAAVVSATVPSEFLKVIPQASCSAGTLTGTVTVLVVVDLYYRRRPNSDPFRVHIESSALGFEEPEPTSEPYVEIANTKKHDDPRIEVTEDGFGSSPTVMPGVVPTDAPSPTSEDPEDPEMGVNAPEPTEITVGTIGTAPVMVIGPSSVVVIGSQTLEPGSQITVGGNPVSLDPSGTAIVIGTRTSVLPPAPASNVPTVRPPPILTIGRSTLTPNAATQFFLSPGQTLTPGGQATLDGTVISLAPSASFVVVGGSTQLLPTAPLPVLTPRPTIVLGGSTFSRIPGSSAFVIGSQTLEVGQIITVGSNVLSLGTSVIVVNQITSTFAVPGPVTPRTIVVGGSTFTQSAGSSFVIGSQTLQIGQPITVDSTVLSLGPNFVVVNQATSTFAIPVNVPTIVLGGSTFTEIAGSSFVIGSQTLRIGQPITVGSTVLSLGSNFVVVNQATSTFAVPGAVAAPPQITLDSSTITADAVGNFVIDGQTLSVGGPAITVAGGTVLSLASGVIVINGVSSTLPTAAAQITPPPLTIGSDVFTALPGSGTTYVIGSATLTPGGIITVADTTISLAPGATALVINGVTTTLAAQAPITNPPLLTIGTETYTAVSGTTFIIEGQTLTPGGVITFDGTTISLASSATALVYESAGRKTTTTLFPATTTRSQSITPTGAASARLTGVNHLPKETASRATGHGVHHASTGGWLFSFILGFLGLLLR